MRLRDFEDQETLCDVCGVGLPKRIVDGLFVCGKCYKVRKPSLDRHITDPDDELPIRRNRHVRSKAGS